MTPHDKRRELELLIKSKRNAVKDKYDKLMSDELHAIDCEHREERQSLETQCQEIDRQRELERIAKANTKTMSGVLVGGKVVEWAPKYRWAGPGDYVKTGVTGIVEICTHDSKFGSNVSTYSQPTIGRLFVRLLKKDGTPSLKFVGAYTLDGNLPYNWHPEGFDPNTERKRK